MLIRFSIHPVSVYSVLLLFYVSALRQHLVEEDISAN
jgi:hypothetical protein